MLQKNNSSAQEQCIRGNAANAAYSKNATSLQKKQVLQENKRKELNAALCRYVDRLYNGINAIVCMFNFAVAVALTVVA